MCKQIRIKILKDDSELNGSVDVYSIEINKIEIGMSECVDSGNVVIGPIKSESEIIKIGTFFEHGAEFSINLLMGRIPKEAHGTVKTTR